MKKIIIWGINVIVIILTVFLVSCIIRNNANRSNDNWYNGSVVKTKI